MQLSRPLLGWRQRGWRYEALQRGRRRWVHIEYPPRKRSPVKKLHESQDKLVFVCPGYIDRLSVHQLPAALQQRLKELREGPVPLYDGRLPWSPELQKAITRTPVPCLAFATAHSHHLLEAFTMDEVLAIEAIASDIRKGFAELKKRLPEESAAAARSRHLPLSLSSD